MKIEEATPSTLDELWSDLEPKAGLASALEEAAQEIALALHSRFEDSVVLARVYVTCPYGALPEPNQKFVRALVDGAGAAGELQETTPVLSLIGTHGQEVHWRDRRKSRSHVGIPLISAPFVEAMPMISRLLRELGVPIEQGASHDVELIRRMDTGLFFVEDAAHSVDDQGRKIIPAQDFVSGYGVKSVFGTGTAYPDGQMVVVIVFTQDVLTRETAERFLTFADRFRDGTKALADAGRVFVSN